MKIILIITGLLTGARAEGLVADQALVIHDDYVEVKYQPNECSFVHSRDEDHPDPHRSTDCGARAEGLVADEALSRRLDPWRQTVAERCLLLIYSFTSASSIYLQ